MKKLLILGAGGYGKTIADLAAQLNCYDKIAFLDDNAVGSAIAGKCREYLRFADGNTEMYPAFGNNGIRMQWLNRLLEADIPVPTLVHPRAYVSPTAKLETGCMVLPMAVVNIGALIDHDSVIGEGCHLAPGAIVKAENRIPAGVKIDSGNVIENREYPL